jgi:hypothetical protein
MIARGLVYAIVSLAFVTATGIAAVGRHDKSEARLGTGPMPCRWKTLQSQGFADPIGEGVTLKYIGRVPGRTRAYHIYYWDFSNPVSLHGRQALLILQYRCRYIGQYSIMARPVRISGDTVFFDAPKKWGNRVRFANGLPPKQAWIDGEVNDFRR